MLADTAAQVVSIDEVNKLVKSANQGYNAIRNAMEIMDQNVLNDMTYLAEIQQETLALVRKIADSNAVQAAAPVAAEVTKGRKISKVRLALAIGVAVAVGIKVNEATKSKKGK